MNIVRQVVDFTMEEYNSDVFVNYDFEMYQQGFHRDSLFWIEGKFRATYYKINRFIL
jgi:hypothetical protein